MKKWMLVLLAVLVVMLPAWAMAETVDLSDENTYGDELSDSYSPVIHLFDGAIITGTPNLDDGKSVVLQLDEGDTANITLQNVKSGDQGALSIKTGSGSDLTITLEGKSTLNSGIAAEGALTIQGDGSLTVISGSKDGICVKDGDLTIKGSVELNATGRNANSGIYVQSGDLTIEGSAEVTASSGRSAGIKVSPSGDLTIKGSAKVKATGGENTNTDQAAGTGISCDGDLTIDIDDNGFVEAIGGGAVNSGGIKNGYGIHAEGTIIIGGRVTAKAGQAQCELSCNGIQSKGGSITIRPGSRVEAMGHGDAGIHVQQQVSGASLLSLPTGGDIFVEFDKLSDVLIMTGATSRTAQERALPDGVTASSLSLANFAKEDVYVLIDTTGNPFPAVPAAPADTSGSLPKTGDSANLALWAALLTVSALCAATLTRKIKKQH